AATYLGVALAATSGMQDEKAPRLQTLNMARFDDTLRQNPQEFLPMSVVQGHLARPQNLPYRSLLNEFEIRPDEWTRVADDPIGCDFPIFKLDLRVTSALLTQPRFQVDVRLEAADTDLDGAMEGGRPLPHIKPSEERFTFIVVSENELLSEIAKEEEKLYT